MRCEHRLQEAQARAEGCVPPIASVAMHMRSCIRSYRSCMRSADRYHDCSDSTYMSPPKCTRVAPDHKDAAHKSRYLHQLSRSWSKTCHVPRSIVWRVFGVTNRIVCIIFTPLDFMNQWLLSALLSNACSGVGEARSRAGSQTHV